MPVLDAQALETDPEGLALLHCVIHEAGQGARRMRRPAKDAFDPARRARPLPDLAMPQTTPPVRRPLPALALGS